MSGTDPGHGGKRLTADVEGLTLFRERDGDGYLSEGDEYEGGFRVGAATETLDSVEERPPRHRFDIRLC